MNIEERFEKAVEKANSAKGKSSVNISNNNLLELYGLFKQATKGDITIPKPSFIYVESRSKWEAWKSKEGLISQTAMREYIKLVEKLF